jgi:hypothetical protein
LKKLEKLKKKKVEKKRKRRVATLLPGMGWPNHPLRPMGGGFGTPRQKKKKIQVFRLMEVAKPPPWHPQGSKFSKTNLDGLPKRVVRPLPKAKTLQFYFFLVCHEVASHPLLFLFFFSHIFFSF